MPTAASTVTALLRAALNSGDLMPLTAVLSPDVAWSSSRRDTTDCLGPTAVITRCGRFHAHGLRVAVEETFTYGSEAVVLGLHLDGADSSAASTVYQVFHLTHGQITLVHEHHDRYQALDSAYRAVGEPRPTPRPGPRRNGRPPTWDSEATWPAG